MMLTVEFWLPEDRSPTPLNPSVTEFPLHNTSTLNKYNLWR
jgi:hypothetical protein